MTRWGVAAALLLVLAGCGSQAAASPSPGPAIPTASDTPEPRPSVPSTSGPLTVRQMPDANALGADWKAVPNPGDEERADPSADSTQRRDVNELMDGLVPVGCPQAAVDVALVRPQWALERTYAGPSGQPGVVLVLDFASGKKAGSFVSAMGEQMHKCPVRKADPDGPVTTSYSQVRSSGDSATGVRSEVGADADPNAYLTLVRRSGARVGVAYVSGASPSQADSLSTQIASAIARA